MPAYDGVRLTLSPFICASKIRLRESTVSCLTLQTGGEVQNGAAAPRSSGALCQFSALVKAVCETLSAIALYPE
jgi:hypothetical protein